MPLKCQEENPEKCSNQAKGKIEKNFTKCLAKADKITEKCKAFQKRVACWSRKHRRAAFWSKFCNSVPNAYVPPSSRLLRRYFLERG
jgi:hypothetical protein